MISTCLVPRGMEGMAMIMMRGMDTVGMVVDMEEDRAPYFKSIGKEF